MSLRINGIDFKGCSEQQRLLMKVIEQELKKLMENNDSMSFNLNQEGVHIYYDSSQGLVCHYLDVEDEREK
jgi:hypothetical protein